MFVSRENVTREGGQLEMKERKREWGIQRSSPRRCSGFEQVKSFLFQRLEERK